MLSFLVTVLFSITCCSVNSLSTGFAGFDGSTTDENLLFVYTSEEMLLIGRIEVGEINSTFNLEEEINLARYNCRLTKVFQLEDRFVAECQQNSLGGRALLVIIYSISRAKWLIDRVVIPNDDRGVRMNEGVSWVYTQSHVRRWYIYARGGRLCSMEFAEGVQTCDNVDPDHCEHILRISSDSISSSNFTLACDSPNGHFVMEYSTSDAKLTPFRLKYPPHEHRYLFVTMKQIAIVGVDSIIIYNNHVDMLYGSSIYCPVPGDGEIVSALIKESSLLYTVASKDSRSMTTSYSTYFLDLSTQQCDERKVGEDGCIVYVLFSANQWWLACPGEIRGYEHNLVTTSLPWPERTSINFLWHKRIPHQNETTITSTRHPTSTRHLTLPLPYPTFIPPIFVCFTALVTGLLLIVYRICRKKFGKWKEDTVTQTQPPNISSGPTGDSLDDHLFICSVHLDSSQTPGGNTNHPHSNCSTHYDSQMPSTSSQRSSAPFTLGSALSVSAADSSYLADGEQSVSLTNTNPSSPSQLSREHYDATALSLSERSSADGASRQSVTPYLSPSVPSSRSTHSVRSLSVNSTPLYTPEEEEEQVVLCVVHCQEEWGQNRTSRPAPGKFTSESSC